MSRFTESSLFLKISLVLLIVGFVLNIVGFASPYWQGDKLYHNGLWRSCYKVVGCGDFVSTDDWFRATRAFATLAFIGSIAALVLVLLYMFAPNPKLRNNIVHLIAMITAFVTAGLNYLAVIIFAAFARDMSWAWALCVVSCLIFNAAGVLLFKDEVVENSSVAVKV